MVKPKKSIFVYLVAVYMLFQSMIISSPLRTISKEYFAQTGETNTLINQLIFLFTILDIVLLIQIIRYRKVWFYISSGFFILNSIWDLYIIIFLYKNYFSAWSMFIILNVLSCVFLLNKQSLNICNLYTEYYKQRKQEKEMRKRL